MIVLKILMFYLNQLLQIIEDFSSPYVYICGDFNANVLSHSRFGDELVRLCSDTLLCLSDTLLLPSDTFIFISSSHGWTMFYLLLQGISFLLIFL